MLLVDVLNALDFPGHELFVPRALEIARRIAPLKQRARASGIPVIYVNDNIGRWRSDAQAVLDAAINPEVPGCEMTRLLAPSADDYVVLKPKHSGFYSTPLDTLLTYLRVERLIILGLTVERCVLFTANDAFLRDYEIFVPRDCTAAIAEEDFDPALRILERVLDAQVLTSEELDLVAMKRRRSPP